MRYTLPAIGLSMALAMVSSSSFSQAPSYVVDPRSTALLDEGYEAQKAEDFDAATDYYEAALAVDPGNRAAYIALAQIARAQRLPGKAVRLYREALALNPNDVGALAGQGEALIQRGAVEKARRNLARIEALCGSECKEKDQLLAALDKHDAAPVLSAEAVKVSPTVSSSEQP
ncbi:MAG: tetratricopeptide repeat protein [Blastomonas sp.]